MSLVRSVTVYCSSSKRVAGHFLDAARDLGEAIARQGWVLVYGGNCIGCMGIMADAARGAGQNVVGISPRLMAARRKSSSVSPRRSW